MASLKEATGAVTDRLEDLVGQLRSELDGGGGDFEKISEAADGLADAFSNVNEQLMQRLDQLKSPGSGNGSSSRRKTSKAGGE
jgi:hypothetical protein